MSDGNLDDVTTAHDDPDDVEEVEDGGALSLAAWQATVDRRHPLYAQFAVDYPAWLAQTFGDRFRFRGLSLTRYDVVIDGKRRQRLARGSGTTVQQVNRLMEARKQMETMMKGMSKGKLPQIPGLTDSPGGTAPPRSRKTKSKSKKRKARSRR